MRLRFSTSNLLLLVVIVAMAAQLVHQYWRNDTLQQANAHLQAVQAQVWQVQRRELELDAARKQLAGRLGMGSAALASLANRASDWDLSIQLSLPLGIKRAAAQLRHRELLLAREKAILKDIQTEYLSTGQRR